FVELRQLPLTPNGKLDRRSLPAPKPVRLTGSQDCVPPNNETERWIASVWKAVLGLDEVGIHDNFFDLGGHSLLVTQVHFNLHERLERPVSLLELFQFPTISALAAHLDGTSARDAGFERVHDRAVKRRRAVEGRRKAAGCPIATHADNT